MKKKISLNYFHTRSAKCQSIVGFDLEGDWPEIFLKHLEQWLKHKEIDNFSLSWNIYFLLSFSNTQSIFSSAIFSRLLSKHLRHLNKIKTIGRFYIKKEIRLVSGFPLFHPDWVIKLDVKTTFCALPRTCQSTRVCAFWRFFCHRILYSK